jgi:hypothetical protein
MTRDNIRCCCAVLKTLIKGAKSRRDIVARQLEVSNVSNMTNSNKRVAIVPVYQPLLKNFVG